MSACRHMVNLVGTSGIKTLSPDHNAVLHLHSSDSHTKSLTLAEADNIQSAWQRNPSKWFRGLVERKAEERTNRPRLLYTEPHRDKGF